MMQSLVKCWWFVQLHHKDFLSVLIQSADILWSRCYLYHHFTCEEIEAQRVYIIPKTTHLICSSVKPSPLCLPHSRGKDQKTIRSAGTQRGAKGYPRRRNKELKWLFHLLFSFSWGHVRKRIGKGAGDKRGRWIWGEAWYLTGLGAIN